MLPLKNDLFLRSIYREPIDMTPVWIMRQAGRYLPEYRATREKAGSFMKLCKTPELACEVTLQPINRYPLDASIIFSDILTIPDAMGLGLSFVESKGPRFQHKLDEDKISRLEVPDLAKLSYVYDAIKLVRSELAGRVPLIGFCGSPWTLAAYMVEGESKPGFPRIMKMREENPFLLHSLLDVLASSVCAHLNAQIVAGAQAVMLFDTWGGLLNTADYTEFSLYYLKQIIAGLTRIYNQSKIPVILFTKGGSGWLELIADSGCDMVGLDSTITLKEAKARVGGQVALQGNMDPTSLLKSADEIREEAASIVTSFGGGPGHVFNLGHGITPDVDPEKVGILIETVHEVSKALHKNNT